MKLRKLRIEHFKRFREPLVIDGFADGLNLFAAPNESGKSTVAEAIRAAFFERHRSGSVEHLRPWGDSSAAPTVDVEFDMGERRYHLTKVFLGKKRCDLAIEGRLQAAEIKQGFVDIGGEAAAAGLHGNLEAHLFGILEGLHITRNP